MFDRVTSPLSDTPDLLRRFVPTLHEGWIESGDFRIHLKTNEKRLLRFGGWIEESRCEVGGANWGMVCDAEMSPELGDPLVLDGQATSFLSFGRACYVAMDHEKKEITGFLSAGISDEGWAGVVLPAVMKVAAERWR